MAVLRKLSYHFFAGISLLLLLLFLLVFDGVSLYLSIHPIVHWLVLFLSPCLLIPITLPWLRGTPIIKVLKHLASSSALILILATSSHLMHESSSTKQFEYRYWNSSKILSPLTQNALSQAIAAELVSLFPYSTQYIFLNAEEATRVFRIREALKSDDAVNNFCKDSRRSDCFIRIYQQVHQQTPFDITGHILSTSLAANYLFEEKKKDDTSAELDSAIRLCSFLGLVLANVERSKSGPILEEFPKAALTKLSEETQQRLRKKDSEASSALEEAYLLLQAHQEAVLTFEGLLRSKLASLKANSVKKLKESKLTPEEKKSLLKRIEEV